MSNAKIFIDGKETQDALFTEVDWGCGNFCDFEKVHTMDAESIPHEYVYFAEYRRHTEKVYLCSTRMGVINHNLD